MVLVSLSSAIGLMLMISCHVSVHYGFYRILSALPVIHYRNQIRLIGSQFLLYQIRLVSCVHKCVCVILWLFWLLLLFKHLFSLYWFVH